MFKNNFLLIISLIFLINGCSSVHETKRSLSDYVIAYRVQLVQTSERTEADAAREKALLDFAENVSLLFEAPFYKVRVGSFLGKEDAEALREVALQKGFPLAWVIRERIDLNKIQ